MKHEHTFTPEEHQAEHVRLHQEMRRLLSGYLAEGFNRKARGGQPSSVHDEILDLMRWSHGKTLLPSPVPGDLPHEPVDKFLIAQNDDPELLEWLAKAEKDGGDFVKSIARAGLVADHENYPMIRLLLMVMRRKYPGYEPSDAVKQEIRERPKP